MRLGGGLEAFVRAELSRRHEGSARRCAGRRERARAARAARGGATVSPVVKRRFTDVGREAGTAASTLLAAAPRRGYGGEL